MAPFLALFLSITAVLRLPAQEPEAAVAPDLPAASPAPQTATAPGQPMPAAVPSPAVEIPSTETALEHRPRELKLDTSDGLQIAAWYYAVPGDEPPVATVILLHDLEGTHKSVEPLAVALRQQGFAVVAPDLRGHGASRPRSSTADRGEGVDAKLLKKNDLEMIAASSGGRIRDQSGLRGDIEAVRNWIKGRSDAGELDIDRLCVVGSGAGAMLAAMWAAADWAWLPTTSGPQGQQVRGVVLVSPSWTTKGLSISTALDTDAIRHQLPILILGGSGDGDAKRLFKQLRLRRPNEWFEQLPDKPHETAPRLKNIGDATLFHIQVDSTLSGDKLASDRSARVSERIKTFLTLVLEEKP